MEEVEILKTVIERVAVALLMVECCGRLWLKFN